MLALSDIRNIPNRMLGIVLLTGAMVLGMNQATFADDLSGKWSGRWESGKSGHQGPLHGRFCKIDDTHYQVRFTGRFWKVFPFRYTVVLEVASKEGDKITLSGTHHLRLFGTFHYHAEATGCDFSATYTTKRDHGTFTLTRQ